MRYWSKTYIATRTGTVSYTHLDVYKRQAVHLSIFYLSSDIQGWKMNTEGVAQIRRILWLYCFTPEQYEILAEITNRPASYFMDDLVDYYVDF